MKSIYSLMAAVLLSIPIMAQGDYGCYYKYIQKFEERGANTVEDGIHEDVIFTFRKGRTTNCYVGKVKVTLGRVETNSMYLKLEDDTYERLHRKIKNNTPVEVNNGISQTMVVIDEELINIFFLPQLKGKKKAYVKAPDPEYDL